MKRYFSEVGTLKVYQVTSPLKAESGMTSKTTKKNNLSKCIVDLKIIAKGAAF